MIIKSDGLRLVIGISLGLLGLLWLNSLSNHRRFDELALGKNTATVWATIENQSVHCSTFTDEPGRTIDDCLLSFKAQDRTFKSLVWFGNSQLHSINQYREGDQTAPKMLHEQLREISYYLMTFSQPNANLQEHYLLLAYLRGKLEIDTLILPLVLDDFREDGIRDGLLEALHRKSVTSILENSSVGQRLLLEHSSIKTSSMTLDRSDSDRSLQEVSENYLTSLLKKNWLLWRNRPDMRARVFLSLYQFRNYVLGIKSGSKRPVLAPIYRKNFSALEEIFSLANSEGINVIAYIVPLRSDIEGPYLLEQYGRFKNEISVLSKKYQVSLYNFEDLVPAELWGVTDSKSLGNNEAVDFMHFQYGGHKLLQNSLYEIITNQAT